MGGAEPRAATLAAIAAAPAAAAPHVRNALTGLAAGLLARFGSAGLGMLLIVLMTRLSPRDQFGGFVVAYNWFQFLQLVPLLGLHFCLARDIATGAVRPEQAARTVGLLALGAAVVLAGAFAAVSVRAYPAALGVPLLLVAASLLPTSATGVIEMVLTGQERLSRVALVNIGESAARCAAFAGLLAAGAGLGGLFAAFALLRLGALAAYLADRRVRRLLLAPGWVDTALLRAYLRRVPVLGGVTLASVAVSRLDIAVLSRLLPVGEVATYGIAARLFEVALLVPTVLFTALLPAVARIGPGRPGELSRFCTLLGRYGLIAGLAGAAVGGCLAGPAVVAVFGPEFAASVPPLRILLLAAVLTAGNQALAGVLLVHELQRFDLLCLCAGAVVLFGGLLVLAPMLHTVGAAWAVLAGVAAQFALRCVLTRRLTGVTVDLAGLASPLGAGLAMAAAIAWLGPDRTLLALPAGLLAFAAVLAVSGAAGPTRSRADLRAARALLAGGAG